MKDLVSESFGGSGGALDNIWRREREVPSSSPVRADMLCRLLLAPCIAGCLFC